MKQKWVAYEAMGRRDRARGERKSDDVVAPFEAHYRKGWQEVDEELRLAAEKRCREDVKRKMEEGAERWRGETWRPQGSWRSTAGRFA
jgi:hypothetical protein